MKSKMVSFKLEVPITYISTCIQHRNEITTAIHMFSGSGNTKRQMYKLYTLFALSSHSRLGMKNILLFLEIWSDDQLFPPIQIHMNLKKNILGVDLGWSHFSIIHSTAGRLRQSKPTRLDLRSPNRLKSAYWGRLPRLIIFEIIDEWHMSSTSNYFSYSGDSEEQKCSGGEIDEVQL